MITKWIRLLEKISFEQMFEYSKTLNVSKRIGESVLIVIDNKRIIDLCLRIVFFTYMKL